MKEQIIRAEFQSKVIQAKAEATETEASARKKSQESSINAGQGDVSDKEKSAAQSAMSNKLQESEIHSETLHLNAPKSDSVTCTNDPAKPGNTASSATEVAENRTTAKTVSASVSMTNDNAPDTVKPDFKANKLADITKEEKLHESELIVGSNEEKPTNNSKTNTKVNPQPTKTVSTAEVGPSASSKGKILLSDSDTVPSTPNRRKNDTSDFEPISPTPLPDSSSLIGASTASSFASITQSKTTNGKSTYFSNWEENLIIWYLSNWEVL